MFSLQHKRRHFAKSRDDLYFCLVCPQYLAFPTQNQLFIHNKECHKKPPKAPGPSNGVQDASLLHSWCSKEKLEEIKAELFDFPQDESLRDLSLRHQCDRCVKGFKVKYQFDQVREPASFLKECLMTINILCSTRKDTMPSLETTCTFAWCAPTTWHSPARISCSST